MALGIWEGYVGRNVHLSKGDIFLDIGAHIGYYSKTFARDVQDAGMVVAVEPDPRNIALLRANTSSYSQVVVVEAACSRTKGTGYLSLATNPLLSALSTHETGDGEVSITTLDDIFDEVLDGGREGKRYVCKIDVEGSALEVLSGGIRFLETTSTEIVLEASDSDLDALSGLLPMHRAKQLARGYYHLIPQTGKT